VAPHPKEFTHPHWYSDVTAVTAGYLRDVSMQRTGRVGVGADVTVYRMAPDMLPYYGSSRSFHVFLRWRPPAGAPHVH
jgi:hypothetical protein